MTGRPRLGIGEHGAIRVYQAGETFRAETRVRDITGKIRRVSATGATPASAKKELHQRVERITISSGAKTISAQTTLREVIELWLAGLQSGQGAPWGVRPQTVGKYRRDAEAYIYPILGEIRLGELDADMCDRAVGQFHKDGGSSRRRRCSTILNQSLQLAIRKRALQTNPMLGVRRRSSPLPEVHTFTEEELETIRRLAREKPKAGPWDDGRFACIIDLLIGTGARIGEVLALRKSDVEFAGARSFIHIRGTVVAAERGIPTHRQDTPKTDSSRRTLEVPSEVANDVARFVAQCERPVDLVFATRKGTPLCPNNVRRRWRAIRMKAGIPSEKTIHTFRKTAGTRINEKFGEAIAADFLGHSDTSTARRHYIRRRDLVAPGSAAALESLLRA